MVASTRIILLSYSKLLAQTRLHYFAFLILLVFKSYCFAEPHLAKNLRYANIQGYKSVHPITKGKTKPLIKADFDGNGLIDLAALIVSREDNGWGLRVFMQTSAGSWENFPLIDVDKRKIDHISRYGLLAVPPGNYKTWCYHFPTNCTSDEPKEVSIQYQSFEFVVLESTRVLYYWDPKNNNFTEISTSD